jgi:hypothetical protein
MAVSYEVFVSHAGEDTWVAARVAEAVASAGGSPFMCLVDGDVTADFEAQMFERLRSCQELVVLLTPSSIGKPYVMAEVAVAASRDLPMGVLCYGVDPDALRRDETTPLFLVRKTLLRLNEIDRYLDGLRRRTGAADPNL